MVQKVDSSISDSDMVQFRNKHSGRSMALGALGSSIMSGFARGGQKKQAAARGMLAGANYGAGSAAYEEETDEDQEKTTASQIKELQKQVAELKQQLAARSDQTQGGHSSKRRRKRK